MSERRIFVPLEAWEREALKALAAREKRDLRQQAALLLRESLEQRGLLPVNAPSADTTKQEATQYAAA